MRPEPLVGELHDTQLRLRLANGDVKTLSRSASFAPADLIDSLRESAGSLSTPLRLRVAGRLAVNWLQKPLLGSAALEDWQLAVQRKAGDLLEGRACWVAADWDADEPFLCAGVDARWIQALHDGWKGPLGLASYWMEALIAHRASAPVQGWLALRGADDGLMLARSQQRRWLGVFEMRLPANAQASSLVNQRLRQLTAREDWPEVAAFHWIDLRSAAPAPDDLGPEWQRLSPSAAWVASGVLT